MGIAFTPQNSTPPATPEQNTDSPINPIDDFFEIETKLHTEAPSSEEINNFSNERETPIPEMIEPKKSKKEKNSEITIKATTRKTRIDPTSLPQVDPMTSQIEKIMEEGIGEAYQELTPIQKQQFKIKGEETARHIKNLLQSTKIKIKKIFDLIFEWLKLLPGVNRYFLMQEAKIKTDKILGLKYLYN